MEIDELVRRVKRNCTISDAKYWGHYSICGLLMRMRELYLSEHSLKPWEEVPVESITPWLQEREGLWQEIEDEDFEDLSLEGRTFSPFDVDGLNLLLLPKGLLYGFGYGTFFKPTFFIANLIKTEEILDYRVLHAGAELCRDLAASPAMSQGRCIYIRRDLVRTIMWDRFQVLKARQYRGLLTEMFLRYGISRDDLPSDTFAKKSELLLEDMVWVFLRHETGELFEDDRADAWLLLLSDIRDKQAELYLRAVKDLLADTSEAGPLREIISGRESRLLYVYMSFLDGLRKELFPEIRNAFQTHVETGDWTVLEEARRKGYAKATHMRDLSLGLHREGEGTMKIVPAIKEYLAGA